MTACPTCGADPCANPSFCAGSRETDAKKAAEDLGAQLAAKLEQQRQDQEARLKELAAKDDFEYDQNRRKAAKALGVRTETLDREVQKRRRRPVEKNPTQPRCSPRASRSLNEPQAP
jgi:hypothetical protein